MTSTTSLAKIGQVAAADLQPGKVFLPFHQGHSEQKRPSRGVEYNLPEDHVPTVIARCQTREDVQLAVRAARAHGLAISVHGAESLSTGRVLKRARMVIDLSAMRRVAVDPATKVAGGATVQRCGCGGRRARTNACHRQSRHRRLGWRDACRRVRAAARTLWSRRR